MRNATRLSYRVKMQWHNFSLWSNILCFATISGLKTLACSGKGIEVDLSWDLLHIGVAEENWLKILKISSFQCQIPVELRNNANLLKVVQLNSPSYIWIQWLQKHSFFKDNQSLFPPLSILSKWQHGPSSRTPNRILVTVMKAFQPISMELWLDLCKANNHSSISDAKEMKIN